MLALTPHAVAEAITDPTRPPLENTIGDIAPTSGEKPVLQSVLISPLRVEAIINGRTVKVGDKVGDAKIVKISESEVLLREGKDLQVLKLFPNVEKRPNSRRHGTGKVDERRQ